MEAAARAASIASATSDAVLKKSIEGSRSARQMYRLNVPEAYPATLDGFVDTQGTKDSSEYDGVKRVPIVITGMMIDGATITVMVEEDWKTFNETRHGDKSHRRSAVASYRNIDVDNVGPREMEGGFKEYFIYSFRLSALNFGIEKKGL